jgi:hypothetical protein
VSAIVTEKGKKRHRYDQDFYAWLMENAAALRQGRFAEVDAENVAEELEAMGRSEKHELENRLAVLLAHLLKWTVQRERRERHIHSWRATIREQRRRIDRLLAESPSLRPTLPEMLVEACPSAVDRAVADTDLPDSAFPSACPFSMDQALEPEYWPE